MIPIGPWLRRPEDRVDRQRHSTRSSEPGAPRRGPGLLNPSRRQPRRRSRPPAEMHQGPAGEGGWPGPDRPRIRTWTVPGLRGPAREGAMSAGPHGSTTRSEAGYAALRRSFLPNPAAVRRRRRWAAGARRARVRDTPARGRDGRRSAGTPCRARARVRLALVGPERHRPLGLGGDGQRRVDAEVGRDRRAVDDVQPGVAVDPLVGVDDAGLGRVADGAAADEVGGQRAVERLADRAALRCRP